MRPILLPTTNYTISVSILSVPSSVPSGQARQCSLLLVLCDRIERSISGLQIRRIASNAYRASGAATRIRTGSDSLEGCVLSQENSRILKLAPTNGLEPS